MEGKRHIRRTQIWRRRAVKKSRYLRLPTRRLTFTRERPRSLAISRADSTAIPIVERQSFKQGSADAACKTSFWSSLRPTLLDDQDGSHPWIRNQRSHTSNILGAFRHEQDGNADGAFLTQAPWLRYWLLSVQLPHLIFSTSPGVGAVDAHKFSSPLAPASTRSPGP